MKSIITHRSAYIAIALLIVLFFSANTFAMTRAEELAAKQAEKAKSLAPYQPNRAEKWVERLQSRLVGGSIGFYPWIGSAFPSGGIAAGPGYRRNFGDSGVWDIHAAYSIAGYKKAETTFLLPTYASGHMRTLLHARYQNADEVAFFGIGNDSREEDETAFTYTPISFGATQTIDITDQFHFGGAASYQTYDTEEGGSSRVPSLEEIFTPAEAPGFGVDFEYIALNGFVEYDWRHSPLYTTTGGFYRVDYTNYAERDEPEGFDFNRLDIELVQHIPILRGNQVLAFRALASITDVKGDDRVPFFLLPKLGGGSELRGFGDFRFRDNNRLLLTGEYRWCPSKFLDMVVFYEVGKVAAEKSDLDLEDLHDSYGIGARFHGPAFTAFRIELARSNESTRLILSGGAAF